MFAPRLQEAKVEIEKERSASAIAVREERLVGLQLQIDRLQAEGKVADTLISSCMLVSCRTMFREF
eukprot:SAG31_NODE_50_length_30520_cov_89.906712_3_plen_66_part_00